MYSPYLRPRAADSKMRYTFVYLILGTPDWIRTSGLWSRSYKAVNCKLFRRKGLVEIAQISAILKKSHRILAGQGSRGFSR